MHHFIQIWSGWVLSGGYLGIIVLMAMGSTPIPLPAEVVVPPAAFLAAQGRMSLAGVIVASTLGAYLGAAVMYWLSLWLGRPLVVRFGRFILFPPKKLEEAEHWLARYEAGGIFFARLLPGVRHLISIPAGIVRMNFKVFTGMTLLGSAISCSILAYLGVRAQRVAPDLLNDPEALVHFVRSQTKWLLLVVVAFAALYVLSRWLSKRRAE
ncbi:MAG TPA: DedA family protein [Chthoniobacterales bacterium]|nr:DedA family protein [Chthoniobacterales bacterium]